jgi:hypothetical protein
VLGVPIGVKGTVWRQDQLSVTVSGWTISASLRMFYRARIAVGSKQVASCGYSEAPPDVTVSLKGSFAYAKGWYIEPDFQIDVEPGTRCRATMFNFDITDAIVNEIEGSMDEYADYARDRIRKATDMRGQVIGIWNEIDEPMNIARDTWLEINPTGVAAGKLAVTADQRYLTVPIALDARPTVTIGPRPTRTSLPLPPLTVGDIRPDFSVHVRGLVTYGEASAVLTRLLHSRKATAGLPRGIRIESATVSGSGDQLVVRLDIRGLFKGSFFVFGKPRFESRTDGVAGGVLVLDDVDYTLETKNLIARIGSDLFARKIERTLEAHSRWDVTAELQSAEAELRKSLNRDLGANSHMSGRITGFGPGSVRVAPNGIEAWYRVSGVLDVAVKF